MYCPAEFNARLGRIDFTLGLVIYVLLPLELLQGRLPYCVLLLA